MSSCKKRERSCADAAELSLACGILEPMPSSDASCARPDSMLALTLESPPLERPALCSAVGGSARASR
eukprot:6535089-Prymnesium_polylepis.1